MHSESATSCTTSTVLATPSRGFKECKRCQDMIDAFDNYCLRRILRITYRDHITNAIVRRRSGSRSVKGDRTELNWTELNSQLCSSVQFIFVALYKVLESTRRFANGGTFVTRREMREFRVSINQSINQSKSLINSCQTATEHIHMNCTNKNNDKMQ